MINKLKKTQPKAQEQSSKHNMLKRFGGKFKRAFSRQKQSLAQEPNEVFVQDHPLQATALPDSVPQESEQLFMENKPVNASAHVGVEEAVHSSDKSPQELGATASSSLTIPFPELISQDVPTETLFRDGVDLMPSTPQRATESSGRVSSIPSFKDKIDNDRRRLVRSRSSPRLPSSPLTGAPSEIVIDSAYHSAASSPQSLARFGQILDERKGLSKECHEARFEHIKGEEADHESAEWVALLKWIEAGHQAELINCENERAAEVVLLKQDRSKVRRRLEMQSRDFKAMKREMGELQTAHAEEVERLKQDRSQVRRRLEMQSRDFKALGREMKEMKELKEFKKESTKGGEEIQPASKPQSNDGSGAESVDEEAGGVILAEEAENSQEVPCESSQAKKDDQKGKRPPKKPAKEERERQRMLRQQLLEESMPDQPEPSNRANAARPAAVGEVQASTTPQSTTDLNGNNGRLVAEFSHLRDQNRGLMSNLVYARHRIAQLTSEAESARAEMATLRAENHFAQLEVGYCHAANACYRATLEDENPARTAHLDGLLKRKDEAYAELESRAAECAHLLAEEKKRSAVDNIYNLHKTHGLELELAHRLNVIQALTEGRDILKGQNDSIIQLFKSKIYPDDAMNAILRDHETTQKDNALLSKMLQERKCYVLDAEKASADLEAAAAISQHAIETERLTHRQTLQSLNGLTATNNALASRIEILAEIHAEQHHELTARLRAQKLELEHVQAVGADAGLIRRVRAQEAHIGALNKQLEKLNGQVEHWRLRVVEGGEGFCPMWEGEEVDGGDEEAEALRLRAWRGERRVRELEGWIWGVLGYGQGQRG